MHCMICGSDSDHYFSKTYSEHPYDVFMRDIGTVDYNRCSQCGFVFSKTHIELAPERWARLNSQWHHYHEDPGNEKMGNQPPYAEQAMMLLLLGCNKIIDIEDMIDYAAGYGTLSRTLERYFQISLPIYDSYVHDGDPARYVSKERLRKYKTVINSAMFEHVLNRNDLDQVNRLVAEGGSLIVHTVVCESIPRDPNWFYLRPPVHTAFHTNRSMELLMDQWGYQASIYCPKSKCWVLLSKSDVTVRERLIALNRELQSDWFYYKEGFMDYWKGF